MVGFTIFLVLLVAAFLSCYGVIRFLWSDYNPVPAMVRAVRISSAARRAVLGLDREYQDLLSR